ncbi:fimbria/pilus periplasmic chaperone [Lysobacter sp. KIS68-7]|uniref:fimbrial biogenesis chaperone n=1 Tax=Lysobacter sp. KIS68-7 TaxID=2904252 RepID=UPI001E592BC1|nr:fimbria/pilus periplasmic chaperone [Lysobacter sp. KIS68-7]UHQ18737.1 fimbria/pilus periplasmic chaperone [Lysobacter sp. KIS68-7]
MRSISRAPRAAFSAFVAIAIALTVAGIASAAQFNLNITRIHLGASHPVETVVMTNNEDLPLAFEVHVKRWRMDADGQWQLTPDDGLVVHPLILQIAPGAEGRVRIGSLSPDTKSEVAYRVELQELPGHAEAVAGHIRMLAKISVPVFVQPANAKPAVGVSVNKVDAHGATLLFRNTGTGYAAPNGGKAIVRDAGGKVLKEANIEVPYLLAGAQAPVQVNLPAGACAHAAKVELQLLENQVLTADVPAGLAACAR